MIEMRCPKCGHQLRIPDRYVGKKGACKHCKEAFVVPLVIPMSPPSRSLASVEAPQAEPARPPASCEQPSSRLGVLFWVVAVLVAPAALVWGLLLRKDHSQKRIAIVMPLALLAAEVLLVPVVGVRTGGESGPREVQTQAASESASAPSAALSAADEAAIRDVIQRLNTATDTGDQEALRQVVAEDCTIGIMGGGRYWDLMTPEALAYSASLGNVSTLDSLEVVSVAGGLVSVKAAVTGKTPDGWSKTTTDYTLRKDGGAWRVAALGYDIETQAGTGKPSALTAADKPAEDSLFTYVTPYPGVTFKPTAPPMLSLPSSVQEEAAVCAAGVTQDAAEKVSDFYVKDLNARGWRNVSSGTRTESSSRGTMTSPTVSGARPGPGGAYKLEIKITVEPAPDGQHITIVMGPTDQGRGNLSERGSEIIVGTDELGEDAMVPPESMGEFVSPYPGVQFELIDAATAPIPSFVSRDRATCVAGVTPDSVETVLAFYQQDLTAQGWQRIHAGRDVIELAGVGWVATDSLSAKLPLTDADYELRVEITLYTSGQGSGILICIGPS